MNPDDAADSWRFTLTSPQAYVFQIARAHIDGDGDTMTELFEMLDRADQWRLVALIAIAEFAEGLKELHGDAATAWLWTRLQHGLDAAPE